MAKNTRWTEAEDEYVRKHYGKKKCWEIAEDLGKTESGVCSVAQRLGLPRLRPHTREMWTEADLEIVKEHFPTSSRRVMEELLPRHTWPAIKCTAQKQGVRKKRSAFLQRYISEELENIPVAAAAYLAGLVDGEGHVSITLDKRRYILSPVMSVCNSDKRIIRFVEKWLPVSSWCELPPGKSTASDRLIESRRPVWRSSVTGLLVGRALPKIIPYLTAKRKRAEDVVRFCEIAQGRPWREKYDGEQVQLFLQVRKVNSRLGKRWYQSDGYLLLREYLISRQAPGVS